MRNLSWSMATAGLVIASLTGCATSPVLTRGQSPDAYAQMQQGGDIELIKYDYYQSQAAKQRVQQQIAQRFAGSPGAESQPQPMIAQQPMYQQPVYRPGPQVGPAAHPVAYRQQMAGPAYDQSYQQPSYGGDYCEPMVDGNGRSIPCQHYKFQYRVPQGLTYPAANALPGIIQYPYYTVKGPDCFFHQ